MYNESIVIPNVDDIDDLDDDQEQDTDIDIQDITKVSSKSRWNVLPFNYWNSSISIFCRILQSHWTFPVLTASGLN